MLFFCLLRYDVYDLNEPMCGSSVAPSYALDGNSPLYPWIGVEPKRANVPDYRPTEVSSRNEHPSDERNKNLQSRQKNKSGYKYFRKHLWSKLLFIKQITKPNSMKQFSARIQNLARILQVFEFKIFARKMEELSIPL